MGRAARGEPVRTWGSPDGSVVVLDDLKALRQAVHNVSRAHVRVFCTVVPAPSTDETRVFLLAILYEQEMETIGCGYFQRRTVTYVLTILNAPWWTWNSEER